MLLSNVVGEICILTFVLSIHCKFNNAHTQRQNSKFIKWYDCLYQNDCLVPPKKVTIDNSVHCMLISNTYFRKRSKSKLVFMGVLSQNVDCKNYIKSGSIIKAFVEALLKLCIVDGFVLPSDIVQHAKSGVCCRIFITNIKKKGHRLKQNETARKYKTLRWRLSLCSTSLHSNACWFRCTIKFTHRNRGLCIYGNKQLPLYSCESNYEVNTTLSNGPRMVVVKERDFKNRSRRGLRYTSSCSSHCKGRCKQSDGTCKACASGYQTPYCNVTCSYGFYGPGCVRECPKYCLEHRCHHRTGHCFGCDPGYFGDFCNAQCMTGYYGDQCRKMCSEMCEGQICDFRSGDCHSCLPGYFGATCNKICPPKTYGSKCVSHCSEHCLSECNRATGACLECLPGYTGFACDETCATGLYGDGCASHCSDGCSEKECDPVDGKCVQCKPMLKGIFCLQNASAEHSNTTYNTTILTVLSGATLDTAVRHFKYYIVLFVLFTIITFLVALMIAGVIFRNKREKKKISLKNERRHQQTRSPHPCRLLPHNTRYSEGSYTSDDDDLVTPDTLNSVSNSAHSFIQMCNKAHPSKKENARLDPSCCGGQFFEYDQKRRGFYPRTDCDKTPTLKSRPLMPPDSERDATSLNPPRLPSLTSLMDLPTGNQHCLGNETTCHVSNNPDSASLAVSSVLNHSKQGGAVVQEIPKTSMPTLVSNEATDTRYALCTEQCKKNAFIMSSRGETVFHHHNDKKSRSLTVSSAMNSSVKQNQNGLSTSFSIKLIQSENLFRVNPSLNLTSEKDQEKSVNTKVNHIFSPSDYQQAQTHHTKTAPAGGFRGLSMKGEDNFSVDLTPADKRKSQESSPNLTKSQHDLSMSLVNDIQTKSLPLSSPTKTTSPIPPSPKYPVFQNSPQPGCSTDPYPNQEMSSPKPTQCASQYDRRLRYYERNKPEITNTTQMTTISKQVNTIQNSPESNFARSRSPSPHGIIIHHNPSATSQRSNGSRCSPIARCQQDTKDITSPRTMRARKLSPQWSKGYDSSRAKDLANKKGRNNATTTTTTTTTHLDPTRRSVRVQCCSFSRQKKQESEKILDQMLSKRAESAASMGRSVTNPERQNSSLAKHDDSSPAQFVNISQKPKFAVQKIHFIPFTVKGNERDVKKDASATPQNCLFDHIAGTSISEECTSIDSSATDKQMLMENSFTEALRQNRLAHSNHDSNASKPSICRSPISNTISKASFVSSVYNEDQIENNNLDIKPMAAEPLSSFSEAALNMNEKNISQTSPQNHSHHVFDVSPQMCSKSDYRPDEKNSISQKLHYEYHKSSPSIKDMGCASDCISPKIDVFDWKGKAYKPQQGQSNNIFDNQLGCLTGKDPKKHSLYSNSNLSDKMVIRTGLETNSPVYSPSIDTAIRIPSPGGISDVVNDQIILYKKTQWNPVSYNPANQKAKIGCSPPPAQPSSTSTIYLNRKPNMRKDIVESDLHFEHDSDDNKSSPFFRLLEEKYGSLIQHSQSNHDNTIKGSYSSGSKKFENLISPVKFKINQNICGPSAPLEYDTSRLHSPPRRSYSKSNKQFQKSPPSPKHEPPSLRTHSWFPDKTLTPPPPKRLIPASISRHSFRKYLQSTPKDVFEWENIPLSSTKPKQPGFSSNIGRNGGRDSAIKTSTTPSPVFSNLQPYDKVIRCPTTRRASPVRYPQLESLDV